MATGDPKNEIHHILKDANGDGAAPDVLNDGDNATSADGQLVFTGWNQAGAARTLQHQTEGAGALGENISVMALKDASGNIQYLKGDAQGALVITDEGAKTPYFGRSAFTPSAADTEELVFTINLGAAGESIQELEWHLSSTRDVEVNLYYVDDDGGAGEAESFLFRFRVDGDKDSCCKIGCLDLNTGGGTGTQSLRVKLKQKQGTPQESFVYVCVKAD